MRHTSTLFPLPSWKFYIRYERIETHAAKLKKKETNDEVDAESGLFRQWNVDSNHF